MTFPVAMADGQAPVAWNRWMAESRVMNMVTIDVTDAGPFQAGDEVVLIGSQARRHGEADDRISADEMASWASTIHYETVIRIAEHVPRLAVA